MEKTEVVIQYTKRPAGRKPPYTIEKNGKITIMVRCVLADGSFSIAGGMSIRLWTNCRMPAATARALTPRTKTTRFKLKRTYGCPTLIPKTMVLMHGAALSRWPSASTLAWLGQWIVGTRSTLKTRSMALGSKLVRIGRMTQYIGKSRPIWRRDGRHPAI